MKIKKYLFLTLPLIVTLLIIFSIITIKARVDASEKINFLKNIFNMEVSVNHNNGSINKDAAYKIAEKYTDNLSKMAKEVSVDHYFLTYNVLLPASFNIEAKVANPKLENGINELPVWIVTYEGIKSSGRSLPGSKFQPKPTATQITVIDAVTGEVIFVVSGG